MPQPSLPCARRRTSSPGQGALLDGIAILPAADGTHVVDPAGAFLNSLAVSFALELLLGTWRTHSSVRVQPA